MKIIERAELEQILKDHKKWLETRFTNNVDGRCADLRGADLRDADLCGANLRDADLCGANLRGAKNLNTVFPIQCPETGAYIAYKKASKMIVTLEIPADALRSSATSENYSDLFYLVKDTVIERYPYC